jgi:opacity protein-like surface antigen
MKKFILVAGLLLSSAVMAESGVQFEFERERATQSPHTMENTIKVAPYVKLDNGVKLDLQFGGSRADGTVNGNNNALENSIEARAQKMWEVYPSLKLGARVSVGEKFNGENAAGKTTDFAYYTVEPKAQYALTDKLSALTSWRYRNAFSDDVNYQTRTWKIGAGYAVTKQDEVEVKYLRKRGDSNSNGIELAYSRSF